MGAHHATAVAFGLEGVYQDRAFACHARLARALGDAFAMFDAHSMQVALILRESIQACPNDAKGASKVPLRSSIRCPVYTFGNGSGPSSPELPSPELINKQLSSLHTRNLTALDRFKGLSFHSTNNENG